MKRLLYIAIYLLFVLSTFSQQKEVFIKYTIDYKNDNLCNIIGLQSTGNITANLGNGTGENVYTGEHPYLGNGKYEVTISGGADAAVTSFAMCDDIHISAISISEYCKLEELGCHGLSYMDVFNAKELTILCNMNGGITSLDLSGNPNLKYINIYDNPIAKDKVALLEMIESLPDRTGKEPGTLVINMGNFPRHKAICERKNWVIK